MSTANELLVAACTSGISCLDEMNLLRVIAQGAMSGGGGGGGPFVLKAGDTMTGALFLPDGTAAAPALGFANSNTTGLYRYAADTIGFTTAGTFKMFLNGSGTLVLAGQIGVNTGTPTASIQAVNSTPGGIAIEGTQSATSGSSFGLIAAANGVSSGQNIAGSYGALNGTSNIAINIPTDTVAATDNWAISSTSQAQVYFEGNVGIGIARALEKLSVVGSRASIYNNLTSATNFERLDFEWSANVCRIWTEKGSGGGTARDLVVGTNATEAMRVLASNQNIGLGVSPTAVLHLKAGTATASTAPLKFNAGVLLTTPEIGAAEFTDDGTTAHFYITTRVATVVTRVQLA